MAEVAELEKDLMQKNNWLVAKLSQHEDLIIRAAQTEHDYRVALATKMLEMRAEGLPATTMPDICRGDKKIAKLKLDRDIAKGLADTNIQAIRSIQSIMSGLQSMLSRHRAEMKLL